MPQNPALVQRGLLLLGVMLAVVAAVGFLIFRSTPNSQAQQKKNPEVIVTNVSNPAAAFPALLNWGALAVMSQDMPSSPGYEVRYNAAIALARKGSSKVPLQVLNQMLDENQQMRNFRVTLADGKNVADEYSARKTVVNALNAFEEWHKHKDAVKAVGADHPELQRTIAAIDTLTRSNNEAVRKEAESVKKKVASE